MLDRIANALAHKHPGDKVAVVDTPGQSQFFYVVGTYRERAPHSPVTDLIQSLFGQYHLGGDTYDLLNDARIRTNYPPTQMCEGMAGLYKAHVIEANTEAGTLDLRDLRLTRLQVPDRGSAERLNRFNCDAAGPAPGLSLNDNFTSDTDRDSEFKTVHRLYMLAAFALINNRIGSDAAREGKNIAALMVSNTGSLLAWGLNTNTRNPTFHAEVNMLQSYYKLTGNAPLPSGVRIYTTLKPCPMCAGMLFTCAGPLAQLRVYYGQNDPGRNARETVLTRERKETELKARLGVKPMHLYLEDHRTEFTPDFAAKLDEDYKNYKRSSPRTSAAQWLTFRDTRPEYEMAVTTLTRKKKRYDNPNDPELSKPKKRINENVRKVLAHLWPFLQAHGVS